MRSLPTVILAAFVIMMLAVVVSGCVDKSTPNLSSSPAATPGDESASVPRDPSATPRSQPVTADSLPVTPVQSSRGDDVLQNLPDDLGDDDAIPEDLADSVSLAVLRADRDRTVWRQEVVAQEYEQALVQLWDSLLLQARVANGDAMRVLAEIEFDSITLGQADSTRDLDHGITLTSLTGGREPIGKDDWKSIISQYRTEGYELVQTEWHHARFDPDVDGFARSTVSTALYVVHNPTERRLVISGDLEIVWQPRRDSEKIPVAKDIDATGLRIASRHGSPAFSPMMTIDHAQPESRSGVQPLLVHDLNQDGLSEVMLVGSNELFWNEGQGKFRKTQLCAHPERTFETGIVADFTNDGTADLLLAGTRGDLLLYTGQDDGFTKPPIGRARGGGPLLQPQVMTAGDIDRDGDLDLWIGQYKISYVGGQMPTPYFDANDGFPAYLLLNDGQGRFTPATEEAGLAEKRNRRSYGGSFVDLDVDGDLDLLVVSDFAGVDLYENDGSGYFRDVTEDLIDDRHLFAMSSSFADFNLDGHLDFFVTGMASTTARRLEYMKLGRKDRPEIHRMRSRMGYGNRMYLAGGLESNQPEFRQPEFRDQVARSGWSWGSTAIDFDNDGDSDLYVANGHSSGESTKDHCTHFWCHDIYEGGSQANPEVQALFNDVLKGYFDRSESWDGYQKNVLLMNEQGTGFDNVAFLMGVGQEFDGRAVVSDDLDADGRVDLLVVEDRWNDGQLLHIYQNRLDSGNHWIGVRLRDAKGGRTVQGCRITVKTAGQTYTSQIVTGDSIHAQHAATAHFGLGQNPRVESVEVRWVDGHVERLETPDADRYHTLWYGRNPVQD